MIDPAFAGSGFAVGALVGLTGVGGGSLMTPLLILLFGIHPVTAVGTDLLFAACTKSVGAAIHARSGTIDWRVTGRLAAGSIPAAALTVGALNLLGAHPQAASRVITPVLAVALLLTALMIVFRTQVARFVAAHGTPLRDGERTRLNVGAGAALGMLVSLSSIGAGALGVTALTLLYPKLALTKVVGSDIAHAIPLTLVAGVGYWFLGAVDWVLLSSLLVGSIPGIIAGSLLAPRVPVGALRMLLAGVLTVSATRLLA